VSQELFPGIPLLSVFSEQYKNLRIVTKAGGFGEKKTLYKIIKKLHSK
jgi:uncharacterized protein YgbK (DUF1537 family)